MQTERHRGAAGVVGATGMVVFFAVLTVAAARGGAGAVAGAVCAAGGALLGMVAAARSHQNAYDHGDADRPSLGKALASTVGQGAALWVGIGVVALAILLARTEPQRATGERAALAGAASVALAVGFVVMIRGEWRREGLERLVLGESTSQAFFVTVLAAAAYALFESLAGAPRLSMWVVWAFGMVAWALLSSVAQVRRVRD